MLKKYKILSITLCLSAIIFSGCKKDKDEEPAPTNPGNPAPPAAFSFVKPGNRWIYRIAQNTSVVDTIKVLTDLTSGNYLVRVFGSDTAGWYKDNTLIADYDSLGQKLTFFKTTSAVNDTFMRTYTSNDTNYRIVASINESVTVPAGTFSCFKIKETKTFSSEEYYFYIDKINGLIKFEVFLSGSPIPLVTYELTSKNF